jgi:segregation and condensation protein A
LGFEVKIPLFEGPFDLLLFFIERDELDIYDIPIAKITDDFLSHLHQMEVLNIEVASEFILVAATLMRIKAKMLLPRPVLDEEGNEIDPRNELVKHLLEYKKYKSVISEFSSMEEKTMMKEKRGNIIKEIKKLSEINNVEAELQDIDLYKLLRAFERSIDRYVKESNKPIHEVIQNPYTVEEQKDYILSEIRSKHRLSFIDLVKSNPIRLLVIYNFLAILEILQQRIVKIYLGEGFNNFWIEMNEEAQTASV